MEPEVDGKLVTSSLGQVPLEQGHPVRSQVVGHLTALQRREQRAEIGCPVALALGLRSRRRGDGLLDEGLRSSSVARRR